MRSTGVRVAALVPLVAFVCANALRAQGALSSNVGGVEIRIVVDPAGRAEVSELVRAGRDTATRASSYQLLTRPCAAIGDISLTSATHSALLRRVSNDPWQLLDDSTERGAAHADATLTYTVSLSGGGRDIPIVVPAPAVARGTDGRSPGVAVSVVLPNAEDRVTFPRMLTTGTSHEWRGQFVAVPSFVSVELSGRSGACGDALPPSSDGGLSWRFWLLVAILVVWVPTYQWWARRQPEGAR